MGESEPYFQGTHALEKELIEICAVDILKGEPGAQDGYVASGGTEANIQAIWIYRNYFMEKMGAAAHEIGIVCSEDSHYSFTKAANLLQVQIGQIAVDPATRIIHDQDLRISQNRAGE